MAPAAGDEIDAAALKKHLTARLRPRSSHFGWRGSREYAEEVEAALAVLDGLLAAGHAETVVALALAQTGR